MKTKHRLAEALREAGAPQDMIDRAESGYYDDFESELRSPAITLVRDARENKLHDIVMRAIQGEFDGTLEEANEWLHREGHLLLE